VRTFQGDKEFLVRRPFIDTTFLLTPDDIVVKEMKAESLDIWELQKYIKDEELRGSDILKDLNIEKYRRYSDPVALIILTLIGFAMSCRKSRGGTALQIGVGAVVSIAYIALLMLATLFVGDSFPAWLAVWLPNIIFFPLSLFLLASAPK
jgi:lipopolysaccharide export system permease protein